MERKTVFQATILGSVIIGLFVLLGCYIVSNAPQYELAGELTMIEKSSGTLYELVGSVGPNKPQYRVIPGPKSGQAKLEPYY